MSPKLPHPPQPPFALIIHDMQNDWLGRGNLPPEYPAEDTERYIDNHVRLLSTAREKRCAVIATAHYLRDDYFDAAPRDVRSPQFGLLRAEGGGADIIEELRLRPGEFLVRKGGGMSAFTGTILDKLLRRLSIRTIVVAGGSTHVGVDSTVREASDRDYHCIVVSDACRSQRQESHDASLLNLGEWFADVMTTDETIALLERSA